VRSGRILAGDRVGKLNCAGAAGEVGVVLFLYGGEVMGERKHQGVGHHGDLVLLALAVSLKVSSRRARSSSFTRTLSASSGRVRCRRAGLRPIEACRADVR
jgi:hypothetical protein